MAVSPGEVLKAVATHELLGDVISQSVWYWVLDAVADVSYGTVLDAIAAQVEALYANMNAHINSGTQLTDVVVNKWEYNSTDGWHTGALVGIEPLVDGFGAAANAFPHSVAAVVTAFTQKPKVRSRKSIGGIVESVADTSTVASAALSALAAFLADWLAPIVIDGSTQLLPVVPSETGVIEYLLYGLVSGIIGSQRQRKPGIGI